LLAQDAYGLGKTIIEELGRGYVRRDPDMSIISLRLSYIIPPLNYADELRQAWADSANNTFNLWSYIDARDVALSCRLALESECPGFDAFYIVAPDTLMREPTLELVNRHFPGVEQIAEGFGGRMSPVDGHHAEEGLGFVPQHTWESAAREAGLI
jgi:UDP-glucose 4-epimerase